ncbi:MAG: hypothetical protein HPY54_14750 [Chthonomonadetes bacterium]|nr:hypothetical protein [Chthonomonadetes bacterium]
MEATHLDYVRMGQLTTLTFIVVMVLHHILLWKTRVRRFVRRWGKRLRLETQKSIARGAAISAAVFLTGVASMLVFFQGIFLSMGETVRDGTALPLLKILVYSVGFFIGIDLTFAGGILLTGALWAAHARRRLASGKE